MISEHINKSTFFSLQNIIFSFQNIIFKNIIFPLQNIIQNIKKKKNPKN